MQLKWNNEEQLRYFEHLLNDKPATKRRHSSGAWDSRADKWERGLQRDEKTRKKSEARVNSAVRYILDQGILTKDSTIIDIGCGPGRFTAEFAVYAKHAVGIDFSENMVRYASEFAASEGLTNTDHIQCDFKNADIDKLGWRKSFDIVFSSITPAVTSVDDFKRIMEMSRRWCLCISFGDADDSMENDILSNTDFTKDRRRDGRSGYALFNYLWLNGYSPRVTYYDEDTTEERRVSEKLARTYADHMELGEDNEEAIAKIHSFMQTRADENGMVNIRTRIRYIYVLWNVEEHISRKGYEY